MQMYDMICIYLRYKPQFWLLCSPPPVCIVQVGSQSGRQQHGVLHIHPQANHVTSRHHRSHESTQPSVAGQAQQPLLNGTTQGSDKGQDHNGKWRSSEQSVHKDQKAVHADASAMPQLDLNASDASGNAGGHVQIAVLSWFDKVKAQLARSKSMDDGSSEH
jgi:hypothetical protein